MCAGQVWCSLHCQGSGTQQTSSKHPAPPLPPKPLTQPLFSSARPVTPRPLCHHDQDMEAQNPGKKKAAETNKEPTSCSLGKERRKCSMQAGSASWQGVGCWHQQAGKLWRENPALGESGRVISEYMDQFLHEQPHQRVPTSLCLGPMGF